MQGKRVMGQDFICPYPIRWNEIFYDLCTGYERLSYLLWSSHQLLNPVIINQLFTRIFHSWRNVSSCAIKTNSFRNTEGLLNANSIYSRSSFTPSAFVLSFLISVGWIEPTSLTLYFARVMATLSLRCPPLRLRGPKFMYIWPLWSFAYPILKIMVSLSSPCTFLSFFIKKGCSPSSVKNFSNIPICIRSWCSAVLAACCCASLNVATPSERLRDLNPYSFLYKEKMSFFLLKHSILILNAACRDVPQTLIPRAAN